MINDVLQMLFIFLVFLFAFALGLTRLYYFYNGMTRIENGIPEIQPDNFVEWASLLGYTKNSLLIRIICFSVIYFSM